MHSPDNLQGDPRASRREFLKTSAVAATAATTGNLAISRRAHAAGSDTLRVGLIGCGGRGCGAAVNALNADPNAKLVAMADLFTWKFPGVRDRLKQIKPDQVAVDDDHCFTGFEAYRQLLECGVDVVLITVPSHFTPIFLKAAIDAGKHVFCEKTHAVDAPGVKTVIEATEIAKQRGLSMVSGLAWRYDTGVQETMKRVHDGVIGEIVAVQEICNTGSLRSLGRRPGTTEMAYQLYDWYDFYWLSADLPGLNLVHNLDKGAWALNDEPPVKAWGMGGRQVRKAPRFGDVWDHHATVYEYANGVRMYAYCRQIDGTMSEVSDVFLGTKGRCNLLRNRIDGETSWRYRGPGGSRFDLEHVALFSAIRSGTPINNGVYMARSSMLALMSTWCSYTGQVITWKQAMDSKWTVNPQRYAFDADPPTKPGPDGDYPISVPGVTKFI